MFQVIYEYQKTWPTEGPLRVEAQFMGEITVSPMSAQRRASGFLAGHVTMMVLAGEPALVWGKQPVWRVPACLHLPGLGQVSTIGFIDVDALTGEIVSLPPEQVAAMQRRANDIATRFTLPAASVLVASSPEPRVAGLHRGAIRASDDFDEPYEIVIQPVRHNWKDQFKAISKQSDDELLDGNVLAPTVWDEEEWEW